MHLPIQGKPSKIKETLKLADKFRRVLDAHWVWKIFWDKNLLEVVEKERSGASGAQKVIDPKKKRLLGILTAHEEITAKRGGETYLGQNIRGKGPCKRPIM